MAKTTKPARLDWTVSKLLRWAGDYFASRGIDSPRTTAEVLLSHALGLRRIDLYLRFDQPLLATELQTFRELIRRRTAREPVAYIVGHREFWTLDLRVTRDTLIPRPETECLVEAALKRMPSGAARPRRVLDLGTGSGCVVLALAAERPADEFFALDRSARALEVARENAGRHGHESRVRFMAGDWFAALKPGAAGFDLIVANPPYIRSGDLAALDPEIRHFEPRSALDGRSDGLEHLRTIIRRAPVYLPPGGWLLLEIGYDQHADVARLVGAAGRFGPAEFTRDYGGHLRVAAARRL